MPVKTVRVGLELPDDARVTVPEAAMLLGRSRGTVWRYVAQGMLPRPMAVPKTSRPSLRLGDVRELLNGDPAKESKGATPSLRLGDVRELLSGDPAKESKSATPRGRASQ
jgi:predicted DNA-binding transcriptional regulator AlpA